MGSIMFSILGYDELVLEFQSHWSHKYKSILVESYRSMWMYVIYL